MDFLDQFEVTGPGQGGAQSGPKPVSQSFLETLPQYMLDAAAYSPTENDGGYVYKGVPVDWSPDLKRIVELPRRNLDPDDPRAAAAWTKHLRRDRKGVPCNCDQLWGERYPDDHEDHALRGKIIPGSGCIKDLKPIQGWTLEEVMDMHGALGILGVGHGKTGLDILLPWALFPKKAAKPSEGKVVLLLIPPKLKRRFFTKDYPQWAAHFEVPNLAGVTGDDHFTPDGRPIIEVVTYSELSSKKNTDLLARLKPDAVIADEAHKLKDMGAVRTRRFFDIFTKEHIERSGKPKPLYVPMSGTITDNSIKEYGHHAKHSLGEKGPVPLHEPTLDEWAAALDVADRPAPPGRLAILCAPGETAHQGYARRLFDTKGVITTSSSSVKCGLDIEAIAAPALPEKVHEHLTNIRELEVRPDGEESDGAMTTANWAREMASGFYSYWAFPKEFKKHCKCPRPTPDAECLKDCAAQKLIDAWFAARKLWNRAVRMRLKYAVMFMDSPDLLKHAAMRWFDGYEHKGVKYPPKTKQMRPHHHCPKCKTQIDSVKCACGWVCPGGPLATWDSMVELPSGEEVETWPAWAAIKDQVDPDPRTKWVDDFLINACVEWGRKNKGIIWTEHKDFGRRVAKLLKTEFYDGGGKDPESEKGDRSIVCSIKANAEGLNLQKAFCKNLVAHPPTAGLIWEQLLGRSHRQGQRAATVECDVFLHTEECRRAFETARKRASYIQITTRTPQKLCLATIDLSKAETDGTANAR